MISATRMSARKRTQRGAGTAENIFEAMAETYGRSSFANVEKIKQIRCSLTRHIRNNGGYRNVVRKVVTDAIEYHECHHREPCQPSAREYRNPDIPCIASVLLIIAAHCCQKYNLQDKPLMTDLLMKVFYCEGDLDRFMTFLDPLVFPFEVDAILYPFSVHSPLGTVTERHLKVLEYFLRYGADISVNVQFSEFHLNETRKRPYVTFCSRIPLVDLPITSCRGSTPLLLACHSISSMAVLLLLRYGADPFRSGQVHHIVGLQFQHPLYVIATKLNASVFWRSHNEHLNPAIRAQFLEKQEQQDKDLKLILKYFARAMTSLPFTVSNHISANGRFSHTESFSLHQYYKDLIPAERLATAAELTHCCRCSIRKILQANRRLPGGIYELPIPKLIMEYLDILVD